MPKLRKVLAPCSLIVVLAVGACGGADDAADDTTDASSDSNSPTTEPAGPTEAPSETTAPAEVTVNVGEPEGGDDSTAMLLDRYTAFENAFWQSQAAGEVSPELRSLVSPDAMVGIEQAITTQQHPTGGSVTVSPVLDDVTLAQLGGGAPSVTGGVITGCSDQTQLRYDGGATGATAVIRADLTLDADGYVVTNYALGPDAC